MSPPVPGNAPSPARWSRRAGERRRSAIGTGKTAISPRSTRTSAVAGATLTDDGGGHVFRTVNPGAYPWRNWGNNWRPAHVHVSVFGRAFCQRLITPLSFEGAPLIAQCPIVQTIAEADAIARLVELDRNAALPLDCLAYRFDIVLRGRRSTMFENRLEGNGWRSWMPATTPRSV